MKKTVVAALLLAALPAVASAMDKIAIQPDTLKWGPAPPSLPKGAQVAVLTGDPGQGWALRRPRQASGRLQDPSTHASHRRDIPANAGIHHK